MRESNLKFFTPAVEWKGNLFIILALSIFIYANTLNNAFVSDDIPAIAQNPQIAESFQTNNTAAFMNSLNYHIGKLNPFVYHLTNILIHSLNSILVFFFLGLFFKPTQSFWGSLVFAVHPVHTEAVTWISGRPYALSSFFLLSCLLLYIRASSGIRLKIPSLVCSVILYFLSLYTCLFYFPFLGVLILYDLTFGRWRKNWRLWLVFLTLASFKLLLLLRPAQERISQVKFDTGASGLSNPIFNLAYSLFSHLGLLLWPLRLTLYHEPAVVSPAVLGVEIFALALLSIFLPLIFKKARPLFFALCLFILLFTPTYSPAMISWLVAERYLYLPSVALSMAVAFVVDKFKIASPEPALSDSEGARNDTNYILGLCDKSHRYRCMRLVGNGLLLILVTLYSLRTVIRNFDWRSHASIWRATVKASPLSAKAHNNMGDVYSLEGNLQKAQEEFQLAITLKPNYADAYHNLANTLERMGELNPAIANYEKAAALNPGLWQSYQALGAIYLEQGRLGLARQCLKRALEIKPDNLRLRQMIETLKE